MTLDDALAMLFEAAGGRTIDEDNRSRLAAVRARYGIDDEAFVPAYFRDGLSAVATGLPRDWQDVPAADRGHSWMLRELADGLPGTEFVDAPDGTDYLGVPSKQLAIAVADRGKTERWAVVPWPLGRAAEPRRLRILDTFAPTADQVREWSRDPDVRFAEQDEDLAVTRPEYLSQLIELAADPAGPKRRQLLQLIDRIATMPRVDIIDTMRRGRDVARATGDVTLERWADGLASALHHLEGHGQTSPAEARAFARVVMAGPRRPTMVLDERPLGDWIHYRARDPLAKGQQLDSLYVHLPTGRAVWSWTPLSLEALEAGAFDGRNAARVGPR